MPSREEEDYYYHARAIEERKAAAEASQSEVVMIHEELARLYEALANHPELRTRLKVAGSPAI